MGTKTPPAVTQQARELLAQMRSLQLASINADGTPLASYAPFVQVDGAVHVYLSTLAQHAQNLLDRPQVSAMLIRDEAHSEEIFARPRLMLDCEVRVHRRDSAHFAALLDQFEARFGETAHVVRGLTDFSLFELRPRAGRLVSGFARAIDLGADAMQSLFGASFQAPDARV